MDSEGGSSCCSSLGKGVGIWLHLGAVLVEGLLTKHPLLSLPGSKMAAVVAVDFLGLLLGFFVHFCF
jgi:hypothetical protein